jgi:pyridoxamine 5'-phosphate oxidase
VSDKLALADLRREYTLAGLRRADLDPDPMAQFTKWFQQALAANLPEANAMTLATSDKLGHPSARIMLLKAVDERGFVFFSNYESRKGRELEMNPNAALLFYWPELERQIRVAGTVAKISREESEQYFKTRPKGSRLAALISNQSEPIPDRGLLEKRMAALFAKYPGEDVPTPPGWGGYCLLPFRLEFWQGRPSRLHDRFEYLKLMDNSWQIDRLAP